jgi:hypothetical protein
MGLVQVPPHRAVDEQEQQHRAAEDQAELTAAETDGGPRAARGERFEERGPVRRPHASL